MEGVLKCSELYYPCSYCSILLLQWIVIETSSGLFNSLVSANFEVTVSVISQPFWGQILFCLCQ